MWVLTDPAGTSISLTEGSIQVANQATSIKLEAGERVRGVSALDELEDKIEEIPARLVLSSPLKELYFSEPEQKIELQIKAIRLDGTSIRQRGTLYLSSNYDGLYFPENAALNEEGVANLTLLVQATKTAQNLNEGIRIRALLDSAVTQDIADGELRLRVSSFNTPTAPRRNIQIDADTGTIAPSSP